jgi:hypothetical protein
LPSQQIPYRILDGGNRFAFDDISVNAVPNELAAAWDIRDDRRTPAGSRLD